MQVALGQVEWLAVCLWLLAAVVLRQTRVPPCPSLLATPLARLLVVAPCCWQPALAHKMAVQAVTSLCLVAAEVAMLVAV